MNSAHPPPHWLPSILGTHKQKTPVMCRTHHPTHPTRITQGISHSLPPPPLSLHPRGDANEVAVCQQGRQGHRV